MRNKLVQKMCMTAVLTAVAYVITAFLIIPYNAAGGYFNFGDVFIFLGSAILGPWWGAFIGVVAGSMADLTAGFAEVIPFTIVAKFLMAVSAGYLFKYLPKYFKICSFFIGGILMSFTYLPNYYLVYEGAVAAWTAFGFDIAQISLASVVAYALYLALAKTLSHFMASKVNSETANNEASVEENVENIASEEVKVGENKTTSEDK